MGNLALIAAVHKSAIGTKRTSPSRQSWTGLIAASPTGTTSTTVTYGTWAAGGGLEYGITDNLSARVEYLHLDKNNIATGVIGPPPTQMTSHLEDNLVRAGAELPLSDHAIAARLLTAVALQR